MPTTPDAPPDPGLSARRRWTDAVPLTLLTLTVDFLTKAVVWALAVPGVRYDVIGDVLRLRLVENTLLGFSIPLPGLPGRWSYSALIVAGLALVVAGYRRTLPHERLPRASLVLVGAGGLANLVERVLTGGVTDFISVGIGLRRWPTFNAADIAVSIGIATYLSGAWSRGGWRGLLVGGSRGPK